MASELKWTEDEMVVETAAHYEWDAADCKVIRMDDGAGEPCLVVLHTPDGRTSTEAGDAGRWHLDGTAY